MSHLNISGKNYIPAKEAAAILGYTSDYVAKLCREGKIPSHRLGRAWYVEEDGAHAFKEKVTQEHEDQRKELSEALSKQYAETHSEETDLSDAKPLKKIPTKSFKVSGAALMLASFLFLFTAAQTFLPSAAMQHVKLNGAITSTTSGVEKVWNIATSSLSFATQEILEVTSETIALVTDEEKRKHLIPNRGGIRQEVGVERRGTIQVANVFQSVARSAYCKFTGWIGFGCEEEGGTQIVETAPVIDEDTSTTIVTERVIVEQPIFQTSQTTPVYVTNATGEITRYEFDAVISELRSDIGSLQNNKIDRVITSSGGGSSSGGDAETLDSLDSLQFLRSDTSDSFTSGTLTFDSGTTLSVNGTADFNSINATATDATSTLSGRVDFEGGILLNGQWGTTGQILRSNGTGTDPTWTDPSAAAISIGSSVTGGTSGSVLFVDGTGDLGQDNTNFYWDDVNNRLGLGGTTTPGQTLSVAGNGLFDGSLTAYDTITGNIFTATSTTATSTLPNLETTQILISGDYITDFAGTGLSVTGGTLNAEVQTSDLHDAVTLAGALDYITLSGQEITRNAIDLSTDVTGNLDISDNTNLAVGSGITLTDDTLTVTAAGGLAQAAGGLTTTGVLEDLNTLGAAASDGEFIVATGAGAFAYESGATARTSLGLGSIATQDASSVAITGGAIDGTTIGATTPSTGVFTSATATQATSTNFQATTLGVGSDYITDIDGTGLSITAGVLNAEVQTSDLHDAVTLAGEDYLSLSGQEITANSVDLATSNVTGVLPDANVANDLTISGGTIDSTPIGATTPSTAIFTNSTSTNATTTNLNVSGNITFNSVTGDEWSDFCVSITGSADLCDGSDDGGGGSAFGQAWELSGGYLAPTSTQTVLLNNGFVSQASSTIDGNLTITGNATVTDATTTNLAVTGNSQLGTVISGTWNGTAIDISDYTNLAVGSGITLTDDTLTVTAAGGLAQAAGGLTTTGVLEDLNTLGAAASDGEFIVATGAGAFAYESGATARTSLGLGSIATQDASSVAITGGAIDGTTIGATTPSTGVFTNATATQATSTNFAITGITSSLLSTNSLGSVVATSSISANYIEDSYLRNDADDTTTGSLTATEFTSTDLTATSTFPYASTTQIAIGGDHLRDITGTGLSVTGGTLNAEVQTSDLHDAVTLAGALDYITLSGQEITRNAIDLSTDVTGTLDISDNTNLAVGSGITLTDDTLTVTAAGGLAQAAGGLTTTGVLEDLNTLGAAASDGEFIVATGAGAFAYESGATARTSLGLGSIATQDASSVAITGGAIDGTTIGATTPSTGVFTNSTSTNATSTNQYVSGTLSLGSALDETYGGTGQTTYAEGDILYASGVNTLTRLSAGADGTVLKLSGGVPTWGADNAGGAGGSGLWATTTDDLIVYPADTSDVIVIGGSATTTTGNILEVIGSSLFDNIVAADATTTNATTTNLAVTGNSQLGTVISGTWNGTAIDISDYTNLAVGSGITLTDDTLTVTAAGGLAQAAGGLTTTGVLEDLNTLGAAASDGEFIVATGAGAFAYESGATARTSLGLGSIATQDASSVAITGGAIDGTTIGATTPSTGVFTNATATQATSTNFAITGITSSLLSTNSLGSVVATSSISANYIEDSYLRNDADDTTTGSLTATEFTSTDLTATSTFPYASTTQIAIGGDHLRDITGTGLSITGGTLNAEVQTSDLHDAVTLAGALDYITLSGQEITRNAIDLSTDVTGNLDISDNTNLAVGSGITLTDDTLTVDQGAIVRNWEINGGGYLTPTTTITTLFNNGFVSQASSTVVGTSSADVFSLPATTDADTGIIYQNGSPLIHTLGTSNYYAGGAGNLTQSGAVSNVAIGAGAFAGVTTNDDSVAIGYNALQSSTGRQNTVIGSLAGDALGSAINNTALGYGAFGGATAGDGNTAIGSLSLDSSGTGANNTALGYQSLGGTSGSNNLGLGYQVGDAANSGSNNIIIGYDIDFANSSESNTLNIGNLLFGTGLDGTGTTLSSGNIGIGTTSPYAKLSVVGETVSEYFTATSTTATSTLPNLETTQILISGDYITDFAGTGLSVTGGTLNAEVQTSDLHDAVTLAGALDYITLSGQEITRNAIDLSTDVTGTLDISDNTNLAVGSGITLTDDTLTVTAAGGLAQAAGGLTTTGVLEDLNTLGAAASDGEFIVATGAGAFAYESGATARTSLGLGSIATQDASSVAITGGAIDGTTIGATTPSTGVFTSATATQATSTNFAITGITSSLLSTNSLGSVVATSSISANYIEDSYLRNDADDTTTGSLTATEFTSTDLTATSTFPYASTTQIAIGGDHLRDITGTGLSVTGGTLNAEVQTSDLHDAVTLAGALDYITLSGQEITRNAIDLSTDVTGTLDISDNTNLAVGSGITLTDDTLTVTAAGGLAQAAGGLTTTGVLEDLNTLGAAASDGEFIVATGAGAFAYESGATARTSLGLGSIATQDASSVAITGGAIDGTTIGATTPSTGVFTNATATQATSTNFQATTLGVGSDYITDITGTGLSITGGTLNAEVQTSDLHDAVTLAGALDYITLSGQEITRNAIDLSTDVTGALTDANVPNDITIDLATLATTVTITDDESTNDTHELTFTTDNTNLESDGDLTYNPSSGTLAATVFSGSGASLTSLDGENIQDDTIDDDSIDFTDVTLADFDIDDFAGDTSDDDDLDVAAGGTGVSTLTDGGILLGNGTGDIQALSVLSDGHVVVGDGVTDPTTIQLLTSSSGLVRHEVGGLELDISGIGIGDVIAGVSAGTVEVVDGGSASDGDVLTIQADGTVEWEAASSGGAAFAWTPDTTYGETANSTTTPIWLKDTLYASSTAFFSDEVTINATATVDVLKLPTTTDADTGVLYMGDVAYFHNFGGTLAAPNFFAGGAGNFTNLDSSSNNNIGIGSRALVTAGSGGADNNIAIGFESLEDLTTGDQNVALGVLAGENIVEGDNNVLVGHRAGDEITSGIGNIVLGYIAADNLTTGDANIFIGYDMNAADGTADNTLNIGNLIFGTDLDGRDGDLSSGNIGIATTTPGQRLSVAGNGLFDGSLTAYDTITGNIFTATSTTATSTLPNLETTQILISGDYITDFAGTGLSVTGGTLNAEVQTSDLHDAVTLAGALDYITLSGQEITRNAIDLSTDVTGTLDISDNTNLAVGSGITLTDDTLTVTAAGGLAQAAGGLTTTGVLEDLNTLGAAASDGEFIVATGAGAFAYESGATARTSLGLGSIATQDASSVAITGGAIDGTTIGATTPSTAIFTNSTSTNATTTNLNVSGNITFNSVTGDEWSDFCVSITGSADLCDGSDDGGGGSAFGQAWEIDGSGYLAPTSTITTLFNNGFVSQASSTIVGTSSADVFALPETADADTGVITLDGSRFLHANNGTANPHSVFLGVDAGNFSLTNASFNVGIGYRALDTLSTGDNNVAIGYRTGDSIAGGSNNTLLGYSAGINVAGGDNNTLIGYRVGDQLSSGSNNVAIGYDIEFPSSTGSNQLNIGNLIFSEGLDGTGTTLSSGNVGIGTTSPYAKLSVVGETVAEYFTATSTNATSTFAGVVNFENEIALNSLYGTSGQVLTSNGTGTAPTWQTVAGGGGGMAIGGSVTSGTEGSVLYIDGSGNLAQDNSDFYWDDTVNGLNLATGTGALIIGDITGGSRGSNSVDIQSLRTNGTEIASGNESVAFGLDNTILGASSTAVGIGNYNNSQYSVSLGASNTATGTQSIAIGYNNTATTTGSIAIGQDNTVGELTGASLYAIALGYSNDNLADETTIIGYDNSADVDSDFGFIGGHSNTVTNNYGVAVGYSNSLTNVRNTGVGYDNTVSGINAVALGYSNTSSNTNTSAVGYDNTASGAYASAFGWTNIASSEQNVAIGYSNTADAERGIAIGRSNTATNSGGEPTAVGAHNTAEGEESSAFGYGNNTTGQFASAFGYKNTGSGTNAAAFGFSNTASGGNSSAVGVSSSATQTGASSFGLSNLSSGTYSLGVGYSNVASQTGASAVGYDNTVSVTRSSAFGWGNAINSSSEDSTAVGYDNTVNSSADRASVFGYLNTISTGGQINTTAVGFNNTVGADGASAFGSGLTNNTASSTMIGPFATSSIHILSSGQVNLPYFNATSTTASSTIDYALGIGTSTPFRKFSVGGTGTTTHIEGNAHIEGALHVGNSSVYIDTDGISHLSGALKLVSNGVEFSLPTTQGGANQVLKNNGSGVLSWADEENTNDSAYDDVILLMHMDGSASSTSFVDSSSYNQTTTATGAVDIGTTQSKFGGASGFFYGGSDDYVTITNPDDGTFDFSGNFTMEFWVNVGIDDSNDRNILSNQVSTASGGEYTFVLDGSHNEIDFSYNGSTLTESGTLSVGTWYHIAVTRHSNNITMFVDGTSVDTATNSFETNNSNDIAIGSRVAGGGQEFIGYIDEVRLTNGTARYTDDFSVPTEAFPNADSQVWARSGTDAYYTPGKIGIGTSSPSAGLSLTQSTNDVAGGFYISATDGDHRSIYMGTDQVLNFNGGSGNTATLNAAGTWTDGSDIAYKSDIRDLDYGLNELMQLSPRKYTVTNASTTDIGFIAQELETIIPEVVFGEDGGKTVAYSHLTALTVNSIQEIGQRISLLDAPTSTPSITLDENGNVELANNLSITGTIDSLRVGSTTAQFNGALVVNGDATSTFANDVFLGGNLAFGTSTLFGDSLISSNNELFINATSGLTVNEDVFVITEDGNIGIGTTTPSEKLTVAGNVAATGFINLSTEESKENIEHLQSEEYDQFLEKLSETEIATYEYKEDKNDEERLGLIAEEAPEEVLSQDGKGVDLYKFVSFIAGSVKALNQKVTDLVLRVDELAAQLNEQATATVSNAIGNVVDSLTVGSKEKPTGITLYDEETGEPYCLSIKGGNTITRSGACGTDPGEITSESEVNTLVDEDPTPTPEPEPQPEPVQEETENASSTPETVEEEEVVENEVSEETEQVGEEEVTDEQTEEVPTEEEVEEDEVVEEESVEEAPEEETPTEETVEEPSA